MDVFTLLKQDHAQVAATIKQVEATDAPTQRQQLFNQIKQALDVHAHIEETIFYPVLKQAAETREITLEAYDEHQDIKDLLAQLAGLPPDDEEWTDTFDELKQTIEHHVCQSARRAQPATDRRPRHAHGAREAATTPTTESRFGQLNAKADQPQRKR
jgi:hypothetical protein